VSRDGTFALSDRRILAYRESGVPDGAPLFYFHGTPGSRLEIWGGEAPYVAAGARLITADRPGIGGSEPWPERTVLDWPDDVAQLAEALGASRIAVMGHSLGGLYALACAYALPKLVVAAAVVGAVPRLDRAVRAEEIGTARFWRLARERPVAMRATYAGLSSALRVAPAFGHWLFFRHASAADRVAVDRPEVRDRFRAAVLEAARQGPGGLVNDMRVALRPWGFEAGDVASGVLIWHGREDRHVHRDVAERYADELPDSECILLDGEGHFSIIETHAERIVRCLVERLAGS
jgi:pimeloyl-ACP methyl ester carboxylesterase